MNSALVIGIRFNRGRKRDRILFRSRQRTDAHQTIGWLAQHYPFTTARGDQIAGLGVGQASFGSSKDFRKRDGNGERVVLAAIR